MFNETIKSLRIKKRLTLRDFLRAGRAGSKQLEQGGTGVNRRQVM